MIVCGLDLSLTSTGIAVAATGARTDVSRIRSTGKATATLAERRDRLATLTRDVTGNVQSVRPDLVVIEGPSFGQARQGGQHDRAGLWWLVVDSLARLHYPVAEVPPASLKTYAAGKGNAAKDAVLAAVIRRYPDVAVTGNDEADALVLACMGARHLGEPVEESLPAAHLAALTKIRWPA